MRKLLGLILLLATPALATDYYVRTDGNDSNTGLANTSGGAWLSPSKCAASPVTAGNRCRIQPGTYYLPNPVTQSQSGASVTNDAMSDCKCTAGSATITCGTSVTGVVAGNWVRCDATGPYFNWTRVASVASNVINLDEGYRGVSSAGNTFLDVASFVEIIGDGSIGAIRLTRVQPTSLVVPWWTQSGTYPEVWSYRKSTTVGVWTAPKGFRQTSATWDKWYANRSGEDTWIKLTVGGCPCTTATTCEAHVENVEGSWCDDGLVVWARPFGAVNPNTSGVQASAADFFTTAWTNDQNYTVLRNIYFDIAGATNGYNSDYTMAFNFGASSALLQDVTAHGGACAFNLNAARTMMEVRNLKCLEKATVPPAGSLNLTHSGLRFYNVEFRGGLANGFSVDYLSGKSPSDPVLFDRIYQHRDFTWYRNETSACGANNTYNCSTEAFNGGWAQGGNHGAYIGSSASNRLVNYITVQNSIIEVTGDGFCIFNSGSGVTYRNNTFGAAETITGNVRSEVIEFGITDQNNGITAYNNIFYVDVAGSNYDGSIWTHSNSWANYVGNNNLFLHPYNGSLNVASTTDSAAATFKGINALPDYNVSTMVSSLGQETNSIVVCYSGCSAPNLTKVFNDGQTSRETFIKGYVNDGTISNYTPIAGKSRAINAGLNSQCPTEDFYGNPRSDGQCDIGAVELQGGAEPAGPHRTDIRPGSKLR